MKSRKFQVEGILGRHHGEKYEFKIVWTTEKHLKKIK